MNSIKSLITEKEKEIEKITYIEEIKKYLERFSKEDILEGYSIENISLDDKIMYELLKEDIKLNPYVIQEREIKTIFGIKVLKPFALGKSKKNLCIWLKKDGFGAGCYEIDMDKLKEPLRIKLETLKLCQEIQDAEVKELKDKMQQAKSGLPCTSAGYHTILELIYEIDKIFGEETNSQHNLKGSQPCSHECLLTSDVEHDAGKTVVRQENETVQARDSPVDYTQAVKE
jgi:hypothetical protein